MIVRRRRRKDADAADDDGDAGDIFFLVDPCLCMCGAFIRGWLGE
jgi:hypothetical protein